MGRELYETDPIRITVTDRDGMCKASYWTSTNSGVGSVWKIAVRRQLSMRMICGSVTKKHRYPSSYAPSLIAGTKIQKMLGCYITRSLSMEEQPAQLACRSGM